MNGKRKTFSCFPRLSIEFRRVLFFCLSLSDSINVRLDNQVKFSVMEAGTHVRAHTGPTNCRLRAHLGLQAPDGGVAQLRVGDVAKSWADGQVLVFDDSFEHEVIASSFERTTPENEIVPQ